MGEAVYDVVIIGAGPAGIFAALELSRSSRLKVLMIEKGRGIAGRVCPSKERRVNCVRCDPCGVLCGWGGAGAFSDGKLTLSTDVGGMLENYVGREELLRLIDQVDRVYLDYGAPEDVWGEEDEKVSELKDRAKLAELTLIPARIRHLGTGRTGHILEGMREALEGKIDIDLNTSALRVSAKDGAVEGIETSEGRFIQAKYVIAAPGREGASWLAAQASALGLRTAVNPVDIGVRVELPAAVMEHITDIVYESKLVYYSRTFDDKVRTFCMCPYGEVVTENNAGLMTVNGHSYAERRTENTNFALLVSKNFTEPFKEPILYGKYVAGLANLLGGGVIVQRLGDLINGRRTTTDRLRKGTVTPTLEDATCGDLSLVFPYRHLVDITEMLQALDKIAPGVYSRNTLIYGVEVKFYSNRLELTGDLETQVANLFAAGDGAGVTRGLMQASASGVVAARAILALAATAGRG
ncbi:MAG: FAD-dependent oxidoreductase [Firmicutes bacterium]|nr:FAD-dependent oxidoreductase [Bacillota bacterium]